MCLFTTLARTQTKVKKRILVTNGKEEDNYSNKIAGNTVIRIYHKWRDEDSDDFSAIVIAQLEEIKKVTFHNPVKVSQNYDNLCDLLQPNIGVMTRQDTSPFVYDDNFRGFLYQKENNVSKQMDYPSIMKSTKIPNNPTQEHLLNKCSIGLNKRKLQLLTNSNTYMNTSVGFKENKMQRKRTPKERWIIKKKSTKLKSCSSSAKHKTMLNNHFNNVNISQMLLPNASPKCIYNTL